MLHSSHVFQLYQYCLCCTIQVYFMYNNAVYAYICSHVFYLYLPPLVTCPTMSVLHCTIYFHGFHVNDTSCMYLHVSNLWSCPSCRTCMFLMCARIFYACACMPLMFIHASCACARICKPVFCAYTYMINDVFCGSNLFISGLVHIPTWLILFWRIFCKTLNEWLALLIVKDSLTL